MELQEIEVTIGKDGQVQVQVRGVKGTDCLIITKDLEEALGGEVLTRIMTPEALEQSEENADQNQNQNQNQQKTSG